MSSGSWIRINAMDVHLDARTVNGIIKNALGRRAESITQNPELRQEIGQVYVDAVTPFVPMKTGSGKLRESGRATTDGRVYWTATSKTGFNYADIQYNTEYMHYTTPGTGPFWTEHVQPGTPEYDSFIAQITPLIVRSFNNG